MTKINNIIELNGKRYDARTGAFLGSQSAESSPTATAVKSASAHHGHVMSDVVAKPAAKHAHLTVTPVKPAPPKHGFAQRVHTPHAISPHQPQHSKTLMRHALKAPAINPGRPLHGSTPTDVMKLKPSVLAVKPKLSSEHVDAHRAERAEHVPRSSQVTRFQPHQQHHPRRDFSVASAPAAPAQPARPATPPPQRDMFETALMNASSHEEAAPKEALAHKTRRSARKHVRRFSIITAVVAMLLLSGFLAFQNKIAIELQLASARAGLAATMPSYHPAGYAAKTLKYSPGTVTIGYRGDNRNYSLVQQASNWDSETLLQNYVAEVNQPYQAYQAAGRTVYVYGHSATWVSDNIWYKVSGNANLSARQILSIATSM